MRKQWMTAKEINEKFNRSKGWANAVKSRKNDEIRTKRVKTGSAYGGFITLYNVDDFEYYISSRTRWQHR